MRVAVIIPCRNEAAALGHVLAAIPRQLVHEIIVVDNGSTDGTADVARAAGARVVAEPTPGYGRACLAGLAALDPSVDTVVFLDGDSADDPEELPTLLAPIAQDGADLVIGSRTAQALPGSLTIQQRIGNQLACALMRRCFGVRYTDLGPFRAIRREALERLRMRDQAFGWTVEMQAKAARHRLRIVEVAVRYRPRIGRSKISGTLRGTVLAGIGILSMICRVAMSTFQSPIPTRKTTRLFVLLFAAVFVFLSISGAPYELRGTPLAKGDRMLGIDVNLAEDDDYDKAFQLAKSLGSEVTSFSINWKDIETAPGTYEDPGGNLTIANVYYPQKSKLALYVRAVDTASKMAPADLETVPFTDKEMAERYLQMIDWVFAQIPDVELAFLSLGDEIDLMMGDHKELYQDFGVFLKTVREEIKKKHPTLLVGFTATLHGLTETVPEELKALNQYSDVVLVSYYPVVESGGMKDPSAVAEDYESLVRSYAGRTIYIEQTGYPTSPFLKSSEAKQREFVRETFRAWDTHASHVKYISFAWLTDLPHTSLDAYTEYYQTSDKNLLEFLRTLGLRTYPGSGQDKEAFRAIQAEAHVRGW